MARYLGTAYRVVRKRLERRWVLLLVGFVRRAWTSLE